MEIFLNHNKGFKWYFNKNIYAKGSFFKDDQFIEADNLLNYFQDVTTPEQFIQKIHYVNGLLSVVVLYQDYTFVFSDKSRFFTIFYATSESQIYLSDEPLKLLKFTSNPEINESAASSFLGSGYVIGNNTLINGIKQVQAGEFLIFKNNHIVNSGNIFSYSTKPTNLLNGNAEALKELCIKTFDNAIKRLVTNLNGRTALVPLSGGFDSRLIASALKKNEYKDVICFTYGKKENKEVKVSERVAKKLGYPWCFVEYTPERIKGYLDSNEFKEYYPYASRTVSMFYFQEYFATKYLKDNSIVPNNAVFLPGHSGDLLGGSQLIKVIPENISHSKIASDILYKKFNLNRLSYKEKRSLTGEIKDKLVTDNKEYFDYLNYSIYEDWDIKEKIAKFNINSSQVFSFFGHQVYFLFWDNELIHFFKDLPYLYKKFKKLYNEVVTEEYFKPLGVYFNEGMINSSVKIKKQVFKDRLKKFLPYSLNLLFNKVPDRFNYKLITSYLIKDAKKKGCLINTKVKYYNAIIVQWYLNELKLLLKSKK